MHTDRGSVYCGWHHRNLIRRYGMVASMSGRGNCYDNAVMQSFFHSLKVDSIHGVPLTHPDALRQAPFEYIEVEYNQTRRHSAIGYLSPEAFEPRWWGNPVSTVIGQDKSMLPPDKTSVG